MGLDITAYSHLSRLEVQPETDEEIDSAYDEDAVRLYADDYPERLAPQLPGFYEHKEGQHFGFRAGAYSGYNQWRNWLCQLATGVSAETLWANEADFSAKPFFELISFSDCEGAIGAAVAAKLSQDFTEQREAIKERAEKFAAANTEWFMDRYEDWAKAFKLAADGGAVTFH